MSRAVLLLVCVLSCLGCAAPRSFDTSPPSGVIEISSGEFLPTPGTAPPDFYDRRFMPIELPHRWGRSLRWESGGWYRLRVNIPKRPSEVLGVYLSRLHMNAAVYINGSFIGDGGSMEDPLARNWNTPLYFTIPPALLLTGENTLLIRLRTVPGSGLFPAVQIGPEQILRPRCELRKFLQNDVTAMLCFALLSLSLFMFGLWSRRRKDSMYLWLSGASLLWAMFSAYLSVRAPLSFGSALQWLSHTCLDFWAVIFMGFVHRFVGVKRPRLERALLCVVAAMALVTACMTDIELRTRSFRICHAITLGVLLYLPVFALRAFLRKRTPELSLLALALAFLMLAGLHDFSMYAAFPLVRREPLRYAMNHTFLFHHFAAPLVICALAWHLTGRFISALDEAEQLNAELEERVQASRLKLEQIFAERRKLVAEQAATEAQERIYRDLHDDIGARLLSLLLGAEDPRQAEIARAALQDLRDVVSRSAHRPAPLHEHLADWRAETMQRAESAKLELSWMQPGELPDLVLSGEAALNLRRILREAVSNVLRHAQASHLEIRFALCGDDLALRIADDGIGSQGEARAALAQHREGRGLRNLRARAAQLGGTSAFFPNSPRGFAIELRLPIARLCRPADPELL
jgi:signal transduction histidine kinase